jgi:hypothetical protein
MARHRIRTHSLALFEVRHCGRAYSGALRHVGDSQQQQFALLRKPFAYDTQIAFHRSGHVSHCILAYRWYLIAKR